MNNKDQNKQDLIERYLLHQLNEAELEEVTMKLMMDADFRKEVEESRLVMKTLTKIRRGKEGHSSIPWRLLGMFLIIVVIGGYYFLKQEPIGVPEQLPVSEEIEKPVEQIVPSPEPDLENSAKANAVEEKSKIPENTSIQPPSKPVEPPVNKTPPIAANFEPNPQLEEWIGTKFRSNEFDFQIIIPGQNAELLLIDQQILFELKGTLETEANPNDMFFQVHLFSNVIEDYRKFRPLHSWDLEFEHQADNYQFEISEGLELKEGLYYYLIQDEDTGRKYGVGAFKVKS